MGQSGKTVILRGLLAAILPVTINLGAVFGEAARFHYWPEPVQIVAAIFVGLGSGFTAVIMLMDGSYASWQNGRKPNDVSPTPVGPVEKAP